MATSPTKALERLALPENEPIRWLLGSILEERAAQSEWYCLPLQFLQDGPTQEANWRQAFQEYRNLLVNPQDAPAKARDELNPRARLFADRLVDFLTEVLAILLLNRRKGHVCFRVQRQTETDSPDYHVVLGANEHPVEVKNLRETRSVDTVLRKALIERAGAVGGKGLNIELLDNADDYVDGDETAEIIAWVGNKLNFTPGTHETTLSDGKHIRLALYEGQGDLRSVRHTGPFDEDEDSYDGLLRKAERVLQAEALSKSCISSPKSGRSIVVMRWCVPTGTFLEMKSFAERLERDLNERFVPTYPGLEILVFHNWWVPS